MSYVTKRASTERGCARKRMLLICMACLPLIGVQEMRASMDLYEVSQQEGKVTGVVLFEEDQTPVIGATILVKGTTVGTITDMEGRFILTDVPASGQILQISYVGTKTEEVANLLRGDENGGGSHQAPH